MQELEEVFHYLSKEEEELIRKEREEEEKREMERKEEEEREKERDRERAELAARVAELDRERAALHSVVNQMNSNQRGDPATRFFGGVTMSLLTPLVAIFYPPALQSWSDAIGEMFRP